MAALADVWWGSFLGGFVAVCTLDLAWSLVAFAQRTRGVGHFRPLDQERR